MMLPVEWVESEQAIEEHWMNYSPGISTTGIHATQRKHAVSPLHHGRMCSCFVCLSRSAHEMEWYRMAHPMRPACLSCSFNFHRAGTSRTGGLAGGKGVSCVCVCNTVSDILLLLH